MGNRTNIVSRELVELTDDLVKLEEKTKKGDLIDLIGEEILLIIILSNEMNVKIDKCGLF